MIIFNIIYSITLKDYCFATFFLEHVITSDVVLTNWLILEN